MKKIINWKLYWIVFGAGLFGVVASLPFILDLQSNTLGLDPLPLPILLITIVQNGVFVGLATFVGLWLAPEVGLGAPLLEKKLKGEKIITNVKRYIGSAALLGILAMF